MRIAIIGRSEVLYQTALRLHEAGHQIACIITAKEAPEYTRRVEDFQKLANAWKTPFAEKSRSSELINSLRVAQAEIGVSTNYPSLVTQEVIDLFPLGILNAHGGDLPRYRGNACQAWAILNGEERIGLCIHKMIGGELDSGDIIARDYLAIDQTTKVTRVWEWMSVRTPELMLEAVQMLDSNPTYVLEQQSKDPALALRCYPRKPEDGKIDWRKPAIDVLRLINACNKPYAGAFCKFKKIRLTIWDAELVKNKEVFCAIPGQITRVGIDGVDVACLSGKIRLLTVAINGDSKLASSILRSTRDRLC